MSRLEDRIRDGMLVRYPYFDFEGHHVWGATGDDSEGIARDSEMNTEVTNRLTAVDDWSKASNSDRRRMASSIRLHGRSFPSVPPEPALGVAPPGAHAFDFAPETARVVGMTDVHQLVKDHVVADAGGHLHQPPVQRDHAARRARAPAGSLIPHGNAGHGRGRPASRAPGSARAARRRPALGAASRPLRARLRRSIERDDLRADRGAGSARR